MSAKRLWSVVAVFTGSWAPPPHLLMIFTRDVHRVRLYTRPGAAWQQNSFSSSKARQKSRLRSFSVLLRRYWLEQIRGSTPLPLGGAQIQANVDRLVSASVITPNSAGRFTLHQDSDHCLASAFLPGALAFSRHDSIVFRYCSLSGHP